MMKNQLWSLAAERRFFLDSLNSFLTKHQLFYKLNGDFYAYIPKGMSSEGQTLQSRNAFIGKFTEKWCQELLSPIANELGLYAVNEVVCDELSVSSKSPADLAFCTTDSKNQSADHIKFIFEIKMSIVNNYMYHGDNNLAYLGNYHTHIGQPSLLRSDSMLKAIGKSLNIRISSKAGNRIPIVILGNSPIAKSYSAKVDLLKEAGVIQGFWSLYPNPCEQEHVKKTPKDGFYTISTTQELSARCSNLVKNELRYFSSMLPHNRIGEIIELANKEVTYERKADKFLQLISE